MAYTGWGREPVTGLRFVCTLDDAYASFQSCTDDPSAPYVDCHAWQFTPASFELLVLEAGAVGLLDWRIAWLRPRPGVEFFAQLVRGREPFARSEDLENRRLELLKQILLDLREQTDWLVDPPNVATTTRPIPAPVRSARAIWEQMLPLRRTVARLRGRNSGIR